MVTGAELVERLRDERLATLERLVGLDPAQLTAPHAWRGATADLRHRLLWLAEGDETRRVQLARLLAPLTATQEAVVIGGAVRGRLLGTLVGLSDEQFDQQPAADEWSVRQILGHVIATDKRYIIAVAFAAERERAGTGGPLRPPDASLPGRIGADQIAGSRDAVMRRLIATRDDVARQLAAIPDALLTAPTNWMFWNLDLRFRLHRFFAHDREHTIQLRKTMQALGFVQNEPQLLLADAQAARGALEALLLLAPDPIPSAVEPAVVAMVEESLRDEHEILR